MQKLKKLLLLVVCLCVCLTLSSTPAYALISLNDQFVARDNCPAVESIRTGSNPGNIRLTQQQTYSVIGKNKDNPSHYLLNIEGAEPSARWVPVKCGKLVGSSDPVNPAYLLALSWQPSFCETKPSKPECQSQTPQRFDATHFVLHGLWPQPRGNDYCNVSQDIKRLDQNKQWSQLPPINLSEKTREVLAEKMPGFISYLHLHEWYKHGTCYGSSPEEYFQESISLLDQVNNSSVRNLFVSNIGKFLSSDDIRNQFHKAFYDGAGSKVQVQCQKDIDEEQNNMVLELNINLKGKIESDTPIDTLLRAGQTVAAGCRSGEVDPAGFN